jgi:septal ring-binding cell division protein DamX
LGVPQDKSRAQQWFARAAKNALVQGYNRQMAVERPALQPTGPGESWDPAEWIAGQDPERYTLQLASSKSLDLIQKYIRDNELQGRAGYYKSARKGEVWYALVLGAYATPEEANAAASTLPEQLSKWSPWVRSIKDIHRVMRR